MGVVNKGIIVAFLISVIYIYYQKFNKVPALPKLEATWWGPGKPGKEDVSVRPFQINVPEEVITDLRQRLQSALPFQPPLEGVNQHYGINTKLLEKIVDYWKTKYDWKQRQEFLNKYPQFQTNIQGLNIHFIHLKPKNVPQGVEVLPLLLLHGWPGSVREFYEILPILTTPQKGQNFVFEVVAPSLPGYGFSDGASKPGLGAAQMSPIFNTLMARLRFPKYYLQGGDWGSIIGTNMAILYPNNVIALHTNMCFVNSAWSNLKLFVGAYFPSLVATETERAKNYPLSEKLSQLVLESGYMHLQATKPDTVGVALRDSPVGLAAYILEKFTTWTNAAWKDLEDGGLTKKFTFDQLLDNVMIYWVTRSITTSMRLYSESFNYAQTSLQLDLQPITIPSGCNRFAHELVYPLENILKDRYKKLIHLTDFEDGGHFAALELPEVLSEDVYQFVEKVRKISVQNKQEL